MLSQPKTNQINQKRQREPMDQKEDGKAKKQVKMKTGGVKLTRIGNNTDGLKLAEAKKVINLEGNSEVDKKKEEISMATAVHTKDAPAAIGPYSQARIHNGAIMFVSGQIGFDPKTMDFTSKTDVVEQTRQAMENMGAILKAGGSSFGQVLKTTVLLASMDDFPIVNKEYAKYFPGVKPARACFACKTLPKNALVEIDAIAAID